MKLQCSVFFVLKMDVGEGLSVAPLGSAGAFYLWLGGEGNRNVRAWMQRMNYVATWKSFWTRFHARFVYRFELIIVYPTCNMCKLSRCRLRDQMICIVTLQHEMRCCAAYKRNNFACDSKKPSIHISYISYTSYTSYTSYNQPKSGLRVRILCPGTVAGYCVRPVSLQLHKNLENI